MVEGGYLYTTRQCFVFTDSGKMTQFRNFSISMRVSTHQPTPSSGLDCLDCVEVLAGGQGGGGGGVFPVVISDYLLVAGYNKPYTISFSWIAK